MPNLSFSDQELEDIAEALNCPDTPEKFKRKLLVLRMHSKGVRKGVIAGVLNISANSVTTYIKQYQSGGLAKILEDKAYPPKQFAGAVHGVPVCCLPAVHM